MRVPVAKHFNAKPLDIDDKKLRQLGQYLMVEVSEAIAARAPLEELWRELLRQYEGVPKKEVRETPIINAPNTEVTVGAVASDSVYAQVIDQIFNTEPLVTCRSTGSAWIEHAKAVQRFVNWIAKNEADVRAAADHGLTDCIQLGTVAFYIPYATTWKKNKVYKMQFEAPIIRSIPVEDFLVPGGSYQDVQQTRWLGIRSYYPESHLRAVSKQRKWNWKLARPCGPISWVRSRREQLGKTMSNADKSMSRLYEIWEMYVDFDIDGDGYDEELLVIWDRTSTNVLAVSYNGYDLRPAVTACYQLRAHLFYGIGVLEMCKPYQEGATEIYNAWITNMMIANARIWAAREGVIAASEDMYPNKVIPLPDPRNDLIPLQMGDVYQSGPQALSTTISMAERRVGVNDMSAPSPRQGFGGRMPGITAISMLQQVNKRFTPAFDGMRGALSQALVQAVWRYRERLLAGDRAVENKITKLLGFEDGSKVIQVLMEPDFDKFIEIELTASSATVSKEADRQSLVMLGTQVLGPYYQQIIQLAMLASQPQTPEPIREVIIKISQALASGIDQIVRTFDQVRDPQLLAVSIVAELEAIQQQAQMQQGFAQILQLMRGIGSGTGQNQDQAAAGGPGAVAPQSDQFGA